ncbi:MAG: hypothetical protein ACP5EP_11500 [Acidobacteriaceae bacterium]
MSRISRDALLRAIVAVQKMDNTQKTQLADEIFVSQPNMLGSFLVLSTLGVPAEKTGLALNVLLLCFQAMKESGLTWPVITEDDLERQLVRTTAILKFYESFSDEDSRMNSVQQYIDDHTEKELLAWVVTMCKAWLQSVSPEETDKYVIQVAVNLVNCVASVPMQ